MRAVGAGQLAGIRADRDHHMAVAFFCRRSPAREADRLDPVPVDRVLAEALDRPLSAFCADLDLLDIVPGLELFVHALCVGSGHHILPDVLHVGAALLLPVVVKSAPHAAGQGRRIPDEPCVPDIRRRPALSREIDDRFAVKIRLNAGAGEHRVLQRTGEELCCIFGNDPPLRLLLLDQDIPVMIQDLRIENGLGILAAPGDGRVGRGHLEICDPAVGPAESEGFHLVILRQRRDAELPDHVPDRIHPDLVEALQSDDVPRLGDRLLHGDIALVGAVEIVDFRPVGIGAGRVRNHGAERHRAGVKGRRVLPDDLDGRSGLAHHRGGPVQEKVRIFLPAATDQGADLAGLRVHEDQRSLLVGCIVIGVVDDLVRQFLQTAVLRRTDRETAPVNEIPGRLLTAPLLCHEVMENAVDHGVLKIGHYLLRTAVRADVGDPGVDIVRLRLVPLLLRDISEREHLIQNIFPPLRIGFRVRDRVISGRIPGNSGEHRAL